MGWIMLRWYLGEILERIRERGIGIIPGEFEEAQERIARKFREGIASALGLPPEAIRDDIVKRWVKNWMKAFVKPEYLRRMGIAGQMDIERSAYELGFELGRILRSLISRRGVTL